MSITVDLGPSLEDFVARMVESGTYPSEAAVIRDAVRIIQDRETRLAEVDAAIARGLADVEAGRVVSADELRAELRQRYGSPLDEHG